VGNGFLGYTSTSYWDTQTTGQAVGIGFARGDSWDTTGLTTTELQSGTLPNGFDPSVWNANPGQYPTLKFQENEPSVPALSCGEILDGSISGPHLLLNGTSITASFTPNGGVPLTEAAQKCGLVGFDWKQIITNIPDPIPNKAKGCLEDILCVFQYPLTSPLIPPFNDPPKGGYPYCFRWCGSSFPFYYDATELDSFCAQFDGSQCVLPVLSGSSLNFFDSPSDFCLPNADGTPSQQYQDSILNREICDFKVADVGSVESFKTELFGILPGFVPGENCLTATPATCVDLGLGFSWTDDFNGTSGGISALISNTPVDPATGTGGILVTQLRNITSYGAPEPSTGLLMAPLLLWGLRRSPIRNMT
jgi:hypothetical protein